MYMFRARIGHRLLFSFALVLSVMILMTLFALWRLQTVNDMAHHLVNDKLTKQQIVADWLGTVNINGVRANAIAKSDSLEVGDYFDAQMQAGAKLINEFRKLVQSTNNSPLEVAMISEIDRLEKVYASTLTQALQFKSSGRTLEVERLVASQMEPQFKEYESAIRNLLNHQKEQAAAIARASNNVYQTSAAMLIALGWLAVSIGAALAWVLTRSIVKPLQKAVHVATRVAAGDLTVNINSNRSDEIGELMGALKSMNMNLADMVGNVREGIHAIDGALHDIAEDNSQLAARTAAQAVTLEKVAASMEELSSTVKENADNARHADDLAVSSSGNALAGGAVVSQVVESMNSISASSKKIVDIISVIDSIAFQTNILALNAAVEAARAGEQGQGFAVVANEVRNLAQRSASAAKEIKELIEQSAHDVRTGGKLVEEAGDTMKKIVDSVKLVTSIMGAIRIASDEQNVGLKQISSAVLQMDDVTQQNALLVGNAVTMAEALKTQSARLAHSVSVFEVGDRMALVRATAVA